MLLEQVSEHRATIEGITTLAQNDIGSYAQSILNESPERVAVQLRAATPAVISQYGEVAAVAGALFYETNRPAPGFTADLAPAPVGQKVASSLGWALLPLFRPDEFELGPQETVNRLAGMVQGLVAAQDRETVRGAAKKDHLSAGTHLFATAGACAFCALMSAQSVRGGHWHDDCKCVEVPAWDGAPVPDDAVQEAHSTAFRGAVKQLEDTRAAHPDWSRQSPRKFLRVHPEFALTNKNITRVMRESFGFTH